MADPLEILSTPVTPVSPDPAFVDALRARLRRALDLPQGVMMTDLADLNLAPVDDPADAADGSFPRPGALPYLTVRGARAAIDFYVEAFGARQLGDPIVMPDGRIGHCELSMGGGVVYLAEEHPELGLTAPVSGAVSVSLMLPVDDADAVLHRAEAAGARVEREPANNYGRRGATLIDPFGHRWMLSAPMPIGGDEAAPIRHGDVGYVSWWTPDAAQATRFYYAVLGWELSAESHQVTNVSMPLGLDGGHPQSTLFCCYAVDDVQSAVRTVRAAGGTAEEPASTPYGTLADCTDNQGTRFALYQPLTGNPRPPLNGARAGDPSYLTFQVRDSAAAREFYGAVLGWDYTPGHVEEGWQVSEVHPMTGMAGGGDGVIVPMWKVPDVPAAVERVRAAGGTVLSGPEQQLYGMSAECLDDQGGRFYLGDA